jgi:hypothetical protein
MWNQNSTVQKITVTLSQIAKMIDHSLLHPTMTDEDVLAGLVIARKYKVATASVKPYHTHLLKRNYRVQMYRYVLSSAFLTGIAPPKSRFWRHLLPSPRGGKKLIWSSI